MPGGYSVYSYSDRYLSYLVQQSDGYVTDQLQNKFDALPLDNLAHTQIGWEKYVLLRVRSGVDGMYHMIAYRESVLYQDAYQSIIKSFLPVLLILIITATAAFLMHRYFYNGVERILALPFPGGNETQFRDPYSYIETNTKRVLNQNSQLVTDIRRHNMMQLLSGLLRGVRRRCSRHRSSRIPRLPPDNALFAVHSRLCARHEAAATHIATAIRFGNAAV